VDHDGSIDIERGPRRWQPIQMDRRLKKPRRERNERERGCDQPRKVSGHKIVVVTAHIKIENK
jgi:hypothetical protein